MKISELRKMVRQVIKEAGVSAGVAGHTGAHGNDIDDFASGPFKADGNVTVPLRHQVDSSKEKRNQIIPQPEQNWEDIDTNLEYDKVPDYAGSSFVNDTNDFKIIDWAYEYDIVDEPRKGKEWTNNTNEFKLFGEGVSKKKKIIKEVSTTVGGTGQTDDLRGVEDKVRQAQTNLINRDTQLADQMETTREAELNWSTHKENEPSTTTTVNQIVTTYTADNTTTHLYFDTNNHPGVTYNANNVTAYANAGTKNTADLTQLRNVIKSTAGDVAEKTLKRLDANYGTVTTLPTPTYYTLSKGGNTEFGVKQIDAVINALAAGGKTTKRPEDGAMIGANPDYNGANLILQPAKGLESIRFSKWAEVNGYKVRKGASHLAANNLIFSLWRMSLGDQLEPLITFTKTAAIEGDAWEFTNSNGMGREVPGVNTTVTKTVSNPEWDTWNTQLEQLEQLFSAAQLAERDARGNRQAAQAAYNDMRQKLEDMKKERDLSFSGMGAAKGRGGRGKSYGKGNIATGKGGKGRTLKGRRSKTVGGTRGGVPSLAALSGMKAVKGKKGKKGKKSKDEE